MIVINIFGGFDAYHVFDELLEKIAFVVTFPNCLDLGLELMPTICLMNCLRRLFYLIFDSLYDLCWTKLIKCILVVNIWMIINGNTVTLLHQIFNSVIHSLHGLSYLILKICHGVVDIMRGSTLFQTSLTPWLEK